MRVGNLVSSIHDRTYQGIVMEVNPKPTQIDHPNKCCRVQWFDGDETYELNKMLEVISERK